MKVINFVIICVFCWKCVIGQEAPITYKFPPNLSKLAGQKLKLSCNLLSGSVPVNFSWSKDGQLIISANKVLIQSSAEDNSILTVDSIDVRDSGMYKCIAKNAVGSDVNEVKVIVKGSSQCKSILIWKNVMTKFNFLLQQTPQHGKCNHKIFLPRSLKRLKLLAKPMVLPNRR